MLVVGRQDLLASGPPPAQPSLTAPGDAYANEAESLMFDFGTVVNFEGDPETPLEYQCTVEPSGDYAAGDTQPAAELNAALNGTGFLCTDEEFIGPTTITQRIKIAGALEWADEKITVVTVRPFEPTFVSVASSASYAFVDVVWIDESGAEGGYEIRYAPSNSFPGTPGFQFDADETEATVNAVGEAQLSYYWLAAFGGSPTTYSPWITFLGVFVNPPSGMSISGIESGGMTATWTVTTLGASSETLIEYWDGAAWQPLFTATGGANSLSDDCPLSNGTYNIRYASRITLGGDPWQSLWAETTMAVTTE